MRKHKILCMVVAALAMLVQMGCSDGEGEKESEYHAYYLNKEKTKIIEENYEPQNTDTKAMIEEYIALLTTDAESVEYQKVLPDIVKVESYSYDGNQLSVYLTDSYATLGVAEEVLCRAAIVRSMVQIPGVSCVSFYIGDTPLTDVNGNVVGLMSKESFVENPGEQINSIQTATLNLYFANKDGDGMVAVKEEVSYISNISMEKLIMEHLLEGPKNKKLISAIPKGTKLVSVTTTNGVCYVNLDEGFLNQEYNIQESIVIYSIVNSLSELPTVNKVQISVNGDTSGVYRDSYALNTLYERNLDYVVGGGAEDIGDTEMKESELPVD